MIGCIIQARMGSSRLPGKVMANVDENSTVLDYVIDQLRASKKIDQIVVATTILKEDDVICDRLQSKKIPFYRGSSKDVLDRYYHCAKKFSMEHIVRITADNPLIDPSVVDLVVDNYNCQKFDYVTTALPRTFPYGTEVEVFSFEALERAWKSAEKPSEREHVTPYFYNNLDIFKIFNVKYSKNISHLRWTIDHINDLKLVQYIISKISTRPILLNDILLLHSKEPQMFESNKVEIRDEGYLKSLQEDEDFKRQKKNMS